MKEPTKKGRDKKIEERIIQSAQELFSLRPHRQVTLREVAQRTGVTLSLTIYYFESKENLYRTALERAMEQHDDALRNLHDRLNRKRSFPKTEAKEILAQMMGFAFEGMYRRASKENWHEKMVLYELIYPSIEYRDLYEKYFKNHYQYLSKVIKSINKKIDDETAVLLAITLVGQVFSFFFGKRMLAKERNDFQYGDQEINTLREMVIQNVLNIIERS